MKNKKNIIGFISGIVLIIAGIIILGLGFMNMEDRIGLIFALFYGIVPFCIGLYMLVNLDKEDEIERVKRRRK